MGNRMDSQTVLQNLKNILDVTKVEPVAYKHGEYLSLSSLLQFHRLLKMPSKELENINDLMHEILKKRNPVCRMLWLMPESDFNHDRIELLISDGVYYSDLASFTFVKMEDELELVRVQKLDKNIEEVDMQNLTRTLLTTGYENIKNQYERLAYFHSEVGKQKEYRMRCHDFWIIVTDKSMIISTEEKDSFKEEELPLHSFSLKCNYDYTNEIKCRTSIPAVMQMMDTHEYEFLDNFYIQTELLPEPLRPLVQKYIQNLYHTEEDKLSFPKLKSLFKKSKI